MASHVLAHYTLGARVVPAIDEFVTLISSASDDLRLQAAIPLRAKSAHERVSSRVRNSTRICLGAAYRVLGLARGTRRRGTVNFQQIETTTE